MRPIDFSQFVNELATLSGQAILPFFRTAIAADDKSRGGAFDPVTEADRAGEATMRQLIKRSFPTHGIVGEEFGSENTDAEYVWILDPIDGTRAFIAGLPTWGTLIGLSRKGRCAGASHSATPYSPPPARSSSGARNCGPMTASRASCVSPAMVATAMPIACSRPDISTSSSSPD
jgi:fructose-1,6-bisphosphatase/inositol monophosphatase family enzyme